MSNDLIEVISHESHDKSPDETQDDLQDELLISPNGKYLVFCIGKKFVGWSVDDKIGGIRVGEYIVCEEDGVKLKGNEEKIDSQVVEGYRKKGIHHMCVSDNKILAYIYDDLIEIIDMNTSRKIELDFEFDFQVQLCNFNLKGELILWCTRRRKNIFYVYSIQDGISKCQKIYTTPTEAEIISILDNKIWLRLNNDSIYEWNISNVHTTIILKKNIREIKTKEIKISDNKDYSCFKLSNEMIIVYLNELEFPIASFNLNDLNHLEDSKDKKKQLIKNLYDLLAKRPSLGCLLFSLLGHICLNELIENSSNESLPNPLNLLYCSESHNNKFNYNFIHRNNRIIKVEKFKLKEELKANNYDHKHLEFSEINFHVLGKYQLEKGSIFWKFKFEDQEISSVELMVKEVVKDLDDQINNLVNGEKVDITYQIIKFRKELGRSVYNRGDLKLSEIEKLRETFNSWKGKIEEVESSTKGKNEQLIEESIKLVDKVLNNVKRWKIIEVLEGYFIEKGNEESVESFIDHITKFEYLREDGHFIKLIDGSKKVAKDLFKRDDSDELKRIVNDIIRVIKDKIMKFETNTDDLVKKFIKEIGVTGITKQLKKIFDVELADADIKKFIKEMTDTKSENIEINKSVDDFIKTKIKLKLETENENIGATKFECLMKDNNELVNKFIEKIELMVVFIEEIEKLKDKRLENNIQMKVKDGEDINDYDIPTKAKEEDGNKSTNNFIDRMKETIIIESAKKSVKRKVKIKINGLKENFIKNIKMTNEQLRRESNTIREFKKFIYEVIELIEVVVDMTKIETSVNEFIDQHLDGIEELIKLIDDTDVKKDTNKFKESLENLIKKIKIKELEEDPIKLADDFINHIKTKIEELELEKNTKLAKDNIKSLGITKMEKLTSEFIKKIEEITEDPKNIVKKFKKFISDLEIVKINEEIVKDTVEQITKLEELDDDSKWRKLKIDFIKRKSKIDKLSEDPNKFEVEITENYRYHYLWFNKYLIRLFCTDGDLRSYIRILSGKLLNSNEIAILTDIGFFIFHLNKDVKLNNKDHKNGRLISLNYFYYIQNPEQIINKDNLIRGWVSYVKNDKESFLKYGNALLEFAIEINDLELIEGIHKKCLEFFNKDDDNENFLKYGNALLKLAIKINSSQLIDDIYKKCLRIFNQDLENNKMFLSIIATSMDLLNEYYPEYVTRFSLDTNMIIDSPDYKIEYFNTSHLYPFSNIEIVDLTRSLFFPRPYIIEPDNDLFRIIFYVIVWLYLLIIHLTLPIFFPIFYILNYFNIIDEVFADGIFFSLCYDYYYYISKRINSKKQKKPIITFIIPYIKFVTYPEYHDNWLLEFFRPRPSPFAKTINKSIYKTWNGEALINFKWNLYGRNYYFAIWIGFTALLGCFTAATTFTEELISNDTRDQLLITSIILGFVHFGFEFRQFAYDPIEWIFDIWNLFDLGAYLVPTCTSIYCLYTNDKAYSWMSFSCLLLDFKFLLFFRAFESFGVYFVIIINVAKKISSFLVVLFIILVSFAHAFLILLKPRDIYSLTEPPPDDNNDPNNPWKLTDSYYQSPTTPPLIQNPDNNTNMFTNYGTSLFSMYLYLIGDSNSLSNWEYKDNPPLAILMVAFSLLIAVYLMNLLIGLLSNAIEEDNNRASYFMQKAKILAEIELFYLFPNQRRWKTWFPNTIYYHANVDEIREKIKELIKNDEWDSDECSEIKKKLLKELNIKNTKQQLLQMLKDIRIDIKNNRNDDLLL